MRKFFYKISPQNRQQKEIKKEKPPTKDFSYLIITQERRFVK